MMQKMNKQKTTRVFQEGSFVFLLFILFLLFSTRANAAIVEPSFETLPIDETMITTVGKAGAPAGSQKHRYVQINDTTTNSSGAVWFNNPVTFTRDFKIEMAFYIENTANDSDGVAFVMQSNGPTALGEEAGPTLGVWSNTAGTNPLSQGAIPNSIAIEFDTYRNNYSTIFDRQGMMDRDTVSQGHHIAWAYPGVDSSYTTDGTILVDKVLHHQDEVAVADLSDGQWHNFTVEFKASESTFTYTVPDYDVNVTIPVDDTFKTNLGLSSGKSVYFGFTGANGGYSQAKAVSFVNVEGLVDLQLRTGIFQVSNNQLLLDTGAVPQTIYSVDKEQEISYMTILTYSEDSDLTSLQPGTAIDFLVPDSLDLVDDTIYFVKIEDTSTVVQPEEGIPIDFVREGDTVTVTLPELERGYQYEIYFKVKNNYIETDKNLNLKIPVTTTFSGNAFSAPVISGNAETHYYNLTGTWEPTVTTGYKTATEAKEDATIVRQNRHAYFSIQIEDENSTSVQLFMSQLVSEEDLSTMTFSEKTSISREQLTDPLTATIDYDTTELQPGTIYYVGIYVIDVEGNQSETVYQAIDFRGIVELNTVPGNFNGKTVTINDLIKTKESDGYFYLKVDNLENQLSITNTGEELWAFDGQLTSIVEQVSGWAEDFSLCFFEKDTKNLLFQLTSEKQRIFTQETVGAADLTKDFNEYDIYFKFKADPLTIVPGTYSGEINWTLTNSVS